MFLQWWQRCTSKVLGASNAWSSRASPEREIPIRGGNGRRRAATGTSQSRSQPSCATRSTRGRRTAEENGRACPRSELFARQLPHAVPRQKWQNTVNRIGCMSTIMANLIDDANAALTGVSDALLIKDVRGGTSGLRRFRVGDG